MNGWMDYLLVSIVLMDEQKRNRSTVQIEIPRNEEKMKNMDLAHPHIYFYQLFLIAARFLRMEILPKPVLNRDKFEFFHSL